MAVGLLEQAIQEYLGVDEVCLFSGLNTAGEDELAVAIKPDNQLPKEKLASIGRQFAWSRCSLRSPRNSSPERGCVEGVPRLRRMTKRWPCE